MNRWPALTLILMAAALVACGPAVDDIWFDGDLDEAMAAAADRDTLVFVTFTTDWCSWCRRFETETLTDAEVRSELKELIAVQLDAEKEGAEAAGRYGIDSYPTLIFLDPAGEEVERIVGYLPPDKFTEEVRTIRTGDTFHACLERLRANPTDSDAIRRVVEGLLERSDPDGAIAKIKKFHKGEDHDHETCRKLMYLAGRDLHYRVYLKAAKLYRSGWEKSVEVPSVPGTKRLHALIEDEVAALEPDVQAERLREARFADARELLDMVDLEKATGDDLFGLGSFAFRGGHYETAAELYGRWHADDGAEHDPDSLNRAAWQLYLAGVSIETATTMAREAYAGDPSADIADTLARLLYIGGSRDEAIKLQLEAAEKAGRSTAEDFREIASRMKQGLDLGDQPAFETYPGPREISL